MVPNQYRFGVIRLAGWSGTRADFGKQSVSDSRLRQVFYAQDPQSEHHPCCAKDCLSAFEGSRMCVISRLESFYGAYLESAFPQYVSPFHNRCTLLSQLFVCVRVSVMVRLGSMY